MFWRFAAALSLISALSPLRAAENTRRLYAESESKRNITIGAFDGTVPHFIDGDSWQTTLILTNLWTAPVYYQIFFENDAGDDQAFDIVGVGRVSSIIGSLAIGQTVEIPTLGTSPTLTQGHARMFNFDRPPNQAGAQLTESRAGGFAIFRRRVAGSPDQEAVVPISDPFEQHFTIPFDNRNGYFSGIAIVNDTTQNGVVTVVGRDSAGAVLVNDSFSLAAGVKQVYLVRDKYPVLAEKAGSLTYSISTIGLSGLGLRFNPTGAFTSTHPLRY